jgi:hypothetical protein
MDCLGALAAAGGLADTSYGRRKYVDYLKWLTSDKAAQHEMAFDMMCRGWALGTKDFKKALIAEAADEAASEEDNEPTKKVLRYDGATLHEATELRWELVLEQCMEALDKSPADITTAIKSADWKVLIAAVLKCKTSATNLWIAENLDMGSPPRRQPLRGQVQAEWERPGDVIPRANCKGNDMTPLLPLTPLLPFDVFSLLMILVERESHVHFPQDTSPR